jgi:flavin reductase (NADH)
LSRIQGRAGGATDEHADAFGRDLREALSRFATGVAIIATREGSRVAAITATSFATASVEPPLVLVCLSEDATVLPDLLTTQRFTVSLLSQAQRREASVFADRFPVAQALFPPGDDPVLAGALAAFVCSLAETHAAGDHRIVVGEVQRVLLGRDAPPLLYYRRVYRRLGEPI